MKKPKMVEATRKIEGPKHAITAKSCFLSRLIKSTIKSIDKHPIVVAIVLFAMAMAVRLYKLTDESLWYDEIIGIGFVDNETSLSAVMDSIKNVNTQAPLYYIIVFFIFRLFGISVFGLRFPSALFGALSVVVAYFVIKKLTNGKVALLSAFLLMINRAFVFHSQDGKNYTLLVFLSLLSVHLYLLVKERLEAADKVRNVGEMDRLFPTVLFILFIITNLLNFYNHYMAGLITFLEAIFLLLPYIKKRDFSNNFVILVSGMALTFILSLPLVMLFLGTDTSSLNVPVSWGMDANPIHFLRDIQIEFIGIPFTYPVVFFTFFLIGFYFWSKEHKKNTWFMISMFVLPIVLVYAMVLFTKVPFLPRHFSYLLPFHLMLIAYAICSIKDTRVRSLLAAGIMIFCIIQLNSLYSTNTNNDWKSVAKDMDKYSDKDDLIIINTNTIAPIFEFYYTGDAEIVGFVFTNDTNIINQQYYAVLEMLKDKNNAFYIQQREVVGRDVYFDKLLEIARPTVTNFYDGIQVYQFALSRANVGSDVQTIPDLEGLK
ncbi:glycosyltransferase family 39 protein [Candidatus Woesearchaeota archaeon]|nr:glycosyltransferase family 39 protein [Candidatus Woesearchaeota archaeon]